MDDVRKGIRVYADLMHQKVSSENSSDTNFEGNNQISPEDQRYINISLALTRAKIRPYKNEDFVAQLVVDTKEDKEIIDGVRKDVTLFIMNRSHYDRLKLEVISEDPDAKTFIPYTPVDKFNFLKQTSPAIELLKNNFKCEIKY